MMYVPPRLNPMPYHALKPWKEHAERRQSLRTTPPVCIPLSHWHFANRLDGIHPSRFRVLSKDIITSINGIKLIIAYRNCELLGAKLGRLFRAASICDTYIYDAIPSISLQARDIQRHNSEAGAPSAYTPLHCRSRTCSSY